MDDIVDLAPRLRAEDREEIRASVGVPAEIALPGYILENRTVYVGGLTSDWKPEILFGVDPIPYVDEGAVIWMVSSPRIYEHAPLFVPWSKIVFEEFHEQFPLLCNFVDARNTRHIQWLKWLGFSFIKRIECFGASNSPFYEFASYRP